jgi:hypothetical protein
MHVEWKRSALVVGAIGVAVAAGAIWNLGADRAFADENEREITGIVEARPATDVGVWRIAGQNVVVTVETEIDHNGQTIAAGTRVEVEGTAQPDGSILAKEIEVDEDGDNDDNTSASYDDDDDDNASGNPANYDDNDNSSGPSARDDDDDDQGIRQLLPVGTRHGDDDDDD